MKTALRRLKDQKRVPLSVRITPQTRARLVKQAAASGRSITQEAEFRLDQSFAEAAYPPEVGALAELLARTMAETGNAITGMNRWSGHGLTYWVDDPYAFDQAVKAALRLLLMSRPTGRRAPHGLLPTLDGPDHPNLSRQIGKQVADGILEVMRGRETGTAWLWAPRLRETLGNIGARLVNQPAPDEIWGPPTTEAGDLRDFVTIIDAETKGSK